MSEAKRFILFKGEDGMAVLQEPEAICTMYAGRRAQPKGTKPAGAYVILVLANNTKIEVVDETVETVLAKIGRTTGLYPVVFDEHGGVEHSQITPKR